MRSCGLLHHGLIGGYQLFREIYCLHFHGQSEDLVMLNGYIELEQYSQYSDQ